jgi:GTP pyrophosphokinase
MTLAATNNAGFRRPLTRTACKPTEDHSSARSSKEHHGSVKTKASAAHGDNRHAATRRILKHWKHSYGSLSSLQMLLQLLLMLQLSCCYNERVQAFSSVQIHRRSHQQLQTTHHSCFSNPGRLNTNARVQKRGATIERTRTRLHDSSSPLGDGLRSNQQHDTDASYVQGGNSTTSNVGFASQTNINNGYTFPTANRLLVDMESVSNGINGGTKTPHANGMGQILNGNGVAPLEEDTQAMERRIAKTAPEINHWTDIMMKGMFFKKNKEETVDQIYKDLRDMSSYDCEQVDVYWDRIMPTVSYLGTHQVAKIYDALRVAYRAHRGQMRKSGEPFIIHPVEVALLLSGLKMDGETVKAGLLHDTVEDTDLTFELVEGMFGEVVRSIVEGETKVSKLPKLAFSDYADEQAENLRQMFVAMTDDYRIIIVKLADRLHNMRTLRHMKPEKQIKISRETLDIFAPLAHRMGIWQFKSELEDTAFMYLYPQEYKRLNRRLRQHQTKFRDTLDKSKEILTKVLNADTTLNSQASTVNVSGRTKEIYSLWHKMETKGEGNLDNIVDVVALRVIITPNAVADDDDDDTDRGVWLCYHVLGLVQHLPGFQPVPTRVKDYISFPKPNGYQSLHTALILNGQTIEVQIRTSMMHQVAEYGMASHWAYTDGKKQKLTNIEFYNTPWLSSIKEWQNDILSARDFVDSVRSELLGKRVFVFLRNGKILNLARGATAIDAAFQIHTEVGLNMHGVEINGNLVC